MVLFVSACANTNDLKTTHENDDPFEPYNRVMFNINQAFYNVFLDPIVYAYRAATPKGFRTAMDNAFSNIAIPLDAVNNLLQGDISGARDNIFRFIVNTTYGMGGINDVASDFGLPQDSQDFGKTMAVWGVAEGPYIELPGIGGSNLRDAFGIAGDFFLGPFTWILWDEENSWYYMGIPNIIVTREKYIDFATAIKTDSVDFYSAMKATLQQNRRASVNKTIGIKDTASQYDFDMDFEDFEEEE